MRAGGETRDAFAQRCHAEALRQATTEEQTVLQKAAPKLARLHDRIQAVQAKLHGAEAELSSLPGSMTTALIGLAVGRSTVRGASIQRSKVTARIEKLRNEWHEADTGLRALVAERDAEIAGLRHAAARAASEITSRTLKPKKNDVEISSLALAWGVE